MTHHCHWPGCTKDVPPKMWGCSRHWYMLPIELRRKVWQAYVPGQEITKTPSRQYVEVAREVQAWIRKHYPPKDVKDVQGLLFESTDSKAGHAL